MADFSWALTQLRTGAAFVQRVGWVKKIPAVPANPPNPAVPAQDLSMWLQVALPGNDGRVYANPIMQRQPNNTLSPWLIGQTDLLATDWQAVQP